MVVALIEDDLTVGPCSASIYLRHTLRILAQSSKVHARLFEAFSGRLSMINSGDAHNSDVAHALALLMAEESITKCNEMAMRVGS